MAKKEKQAADVALAKLRDFTFGDREAMDWLEVVQRFLGTLRQEKSRLSDAHDTAAKANQQQRERISQLETQLNGLTKELTQAQSRQRQAETEARTAQERLAAIDNYEQDPELTEVTADEWWTVLKALKKRCARAPVPTGPNYYFDIAYFKTGHSFDYVTMGMLACVMAGAIQRVGFMDATNIYAKHEALDDATHNERLHAFARWAGNNLIRGHRLEKKILGVLGKLEVPAFDADINTLLKEDDLHREAPIPPDSYAI